MANVTFSSPRLARDITVYAVAGDRGTILAVAKAHKIPIPFDCQDGECGSCLVEVEHLSPKTRNAIALTEKEKDLLRQLGKITKDEIHDAEVNDMPPRYRLACQCFVRNEDVVVSFEGDETISAQGPYITPAAKYFAGGTVIGSIDELVGYAIKVEEDAAVHYDALASVMDGCGNGEVARLFRQLAGSSRTYLANARTKAGAAEAVKELPADYAWPDQATPERQSDLAGDPVLSRMGALHAALQGETRGYEFYIALSATTKTPEVETMAKAFARQKFEHVKVLEASIVREQWAEKSAKQNGNGAG